jgi:hypothetical protein
MFNSLLSALPGAVRRAGSLTTRWQAWSLLALVWLLNVTAAQAQFNYTMTPSSGTYTPLTAAATAVPVILDDDVASAALPIGFSFTYDGVAYTQLYASSNGTLSFGTAVSSTANDLATGSRNLLAPLWDDIDGRPATPAVAFAGYELTGTGTSRVFTFEWRNWEWNYQANAAVISFQVKLYEGTNRIQFVYRQETAAPTAATASIGLAGVASGEFLSLADTSPAPVTSTTTSTNSINTKPATGQIYTFIPGTPVACPAPRTLVATAVTATSATLGFTQNGTGGTYTVVYGPTGFNPATGGTTVSGITGSSTNVSGLTPGTVYQFYVTRVCGGTAGNSVQVGPVSFTTTIVNDDPVGATTVPITATCTTPTSSTNTGATTTPVNGYTNPSGCAIASTPKDVWFKFTTAATGPTSTAVRIIVAGTVAGQVRLFSATSAAGPFTQVACSGGTTNNTQAAPLDAAGLTPSTTYYVFVSGYGSGDTQGAFTICVTDPPTCGDPTNATIANVTTTGAQITFTPGNGNTSYTVTITPQGGTTTTITPNPTASPITLSGLTQATQYTVTIRGNCAGGGTSQTLTGVFTTASPAPANDDCANAATLAVGTGTTCTVTTGSTAGATASPASVPVPTCGGPTNGPLLDVWYRLTVPANGNLTVTTSAITGSPLTDTVLELYSGTCGALTSIGCSDDATGNYSNVALTGLTAGSTVYARVRSYGTTALGQFGICASGAGAAATCAPVTNLANGSITNTTASITFTAPTGATGYIVTVTPQGGTATTITPAPTASPINLTGLTAGTTYTVSVTNNCGTGNTSTAVTTTFTTTGGSTAPANDNCANATALTIGATCTVTTGTTAGATASTAPVPVPTCGGPTTGPLLDVWYRVTVPANGNVTVTTSAITGSLVDDTVLELYSGTCAALTSIGCNDDTGTTGFSTVSVTGQTAGATLYVRVRSYGTSALGQFGICATSPTVVCGDPTNATIANVTNTSVTLTFTAGANNTSYIVTYYPTATPANTTTVTPAPTASPIVVNGLTPGTAYTITIQASCGAGGLGQVLGGTFTTQLVAAPANDNPGGAIALPVTATCTPTNGTNAGATTTTPNGYVNPSTTPNTCGIASNPKDVWYTFTTAASGTGSTGVTITVTGSTAGLVRVFRSASGANGPFTQVTCTAGAANNTVAPALPVTGLTPSTTYYVFVSGYGSADTQGAFTICVTGTPLAATCVNAAPQVFSTTATTASVSFTPSTGATSYVASLRTLPASGAATVLTPAPTTSPYALTGLTPATRYRVYIRSNCPGGLAIDSADFTTRGLPVSNIAAGNFSATSAQLTFTAPAGATSYTVTYVPQGGTTPITITVPASPFTLTGLTANTTYNITIVANYANGATSTEVLFSFRVPFGSASRASLGNGVLSVFPNPAHRSFTLTLPAITGARVAQVTLINSLGQQVQSRSIELNADGTQTLMTVADLATGIYTLKVQAGAQSATQQVVLQ